MPSAVLNNEFDQLEWIPVVSSNLDYVAYTPGIGRLWVWFKRNKGSSPKFSVYAYDHVPQTVFDGLMNANSHGSFFARNVRNVYAVHTVA